MRLVILSLLLAAAADARRPRGIVGQQAPPVATDGWQNLPTDLDPDAFAGRVTVLFFFQSWCPGCHERGFPTLRALSLRYGKAVTFLVVQTVFEGGSVNTAAAGRADLEKHGVADLPFAHDGGRGKRSRTMARYRSGGTPWLVIVDQKGVVRFNGFHLDLRKAVPFIDRLLVE